MTRARCADRTAIGRLGFTRSPDAPPARSAPPCARRRPSRPGPDQADLQVVGDVESISTPRFIGPGCITRRPVRRRQACARSRPNKRESSRVEGTKRPAHPLELQAQHHHHVGAGEALLAACRGRPRRPSARLRAAAASAARPRRTCAPSALQQGTFERATRLCSTSPQMATVSPSIRPTGGGSAARRAGPGSGARAGRRRR